MYGPRDTGKNKNKTVDNAFDSTNEFLCKIFEDIYPKAVKAFEDNTPIINEGYTHIKRINKDFPSDVYYDFKITTYDVLFEMARRYYNLLERVSKDSTG